MRFVALSSLLLRQLAHLFMFLLDARWVTDDYYEGPAREECLKNGIEPGSEVGELPDPALPNSDKAVNAEANAGQSGRIDKHTPFCRWSLILYDGSFNLLTLSSTADTVGGPTTHFAGNGLDPFADAGLGNKRSKLNTAGYTPENWMHQFAKNVAEKNQSLLKERRERLQKFTQGFMWERSAEEVAAAVAEAAEGEGMDESMLLPNAAGGMGRPTSLKGKEREGSFLAGGNGSYAPSPLGYGTSSRATPMQEDPGTPGYHGGVGGATEDRKRKREFDIGAPMGLYDP